MTTSDPRAQAVALLYRDRRLAHRKLFAHRHPNTTPQFHDLLIDDWHSSVARILWVVFRGGAKSTIGEEGMILNACFREFRHGLILGSSLDRACERLHAIRREFEKNEEVNTLFGPCRGQPWGDELIELPWGVTIRAMGRGQALRGTKDEVIRPDFIFPDDIEDMESVRTEESRKKVQDWFLTEVLPAADPKARVRLAANMLDPECLARKLMVKASGWKYRVIPWEYLDDRGQRAATWAARFPLSYIDEQRNMYYALGKGREYKREYMCEAEPMEDRVFRPEMKRVEPRVRTWEPVYCMMDSARTVGRAAATTGFAAWSWIGPRLIIWDLWAKQLMPDEQIAALFEANETYHPVKLGFEEDGLEEWARQPLREAQARRGVTLPLVGCRAPKGKLDFIRALQPYFNAREVVFAKDCPEGWMQFLSFPGGLIDAPNALAYCLHPKLKSGVPIYEDFTSANVQPELLMSSDAAWLALNADGTFVTAALMQMVDGRITVLRDWVREGDPAVVAREMVQNANVEAERQCRLVTPRDQFETYTNKGLVQPLTKLGLQVRRGGGIEDGRAELRRVLRMQSRGLPLFQVATAARFTLNGFVGGYCRAVLKGGALADFAEGGVYKTMLEGVEAVAGLLKLGTDDDDAERLNATSRDGRAYFSARPQAGVARG